MPVASHEPVKLSPFERAGMIFGLPVLFTRLFLRVIWTLPSRYLAGWPFRRTLTASFVYAVDQTFSNRQKLASSPTTGNTIRAYCSKHNLQLKTTEFEAGRDTPPAAWHEIPLPKQNHSTDNILVWLHGGGYTNPVSGAAHVPTVLAYAESMAAKSVFFLEYSLAPGVKYPGQLVQAVAALENLVVDQGYDLSQIVLAGDSAGGNLALALLAHIIQPSPYAKHVTFLEPSPKKRFKGLLLLSPWVSIPTKAASYHENGTTDILSASKLQWFIDQWSPKEELWADFLLAPKGFWKDIPVDHTLMVCGSWECFRDDIIQLSNEMGFAQGKGSKQRLVVGDKEIHCQPEVDVAGGAPIVGSSAEIVEWLKELAL